jgi:predicted nucleotidyltransferase
MNIFVEEHLDILRSLLKHDVDFMLIGVMLSYFMAIGGTTGDMDLWLKPDQNNKLKFLSVLADLEIEESIIASVEKLDFEDTQVFTFDDEPQKIDFLTRISGVEYDAAEKNKIIGDIDGLKIPVIHLNDLVLSKMSSNRLKDKLDIQELQKIANSK